MLHKLLLFAKLYVHQFVSKSIMQIYNPNRGPEIARKTARFLNATVPDRTDHPWVSGVGWFGLINNESAELFQAFLRLLIVEWLRCGKKVMPENAAIQGAGLDYDGYTHWELHLTPRDRYRNDGLPPTPIDLEDPAASSWLWQVYWDWNMRIRPQANFDQSGNLFFEMISPISSDVPPPSICPPFLNRDAPSIHIWDESLLWFVMLMNSGHASILERCVHCGLFFTRERKPKRGQSNPSNATCDNCVGKGSALRTQSSRDRLKREMVQTAATLWVEWVRSNRNPDQKAWVAAKVSKQFAKRLKAPIQSKWVAQNMDGIETEIKRRKNAKG